MTKRIKEVRLSEYPDLDGPLTEVVADLQEILDRHPDKVLLLEVEAWEDTLSVRVLHKREETDEEYQYRLEADQRAKEQRRANYEALKKEFEGK